MKTILILLLSIFVLFAKEEALRADIISAQLLNEDISFVDDSILRDNISDGHLTHAMLLAWTPDDGIANDSSRKITYFIEQTIYTPELENKKKAELVVDDRPYAGFLGLGVYIQKNQKNDRQFAQTGGHGDRRYRPDLPGG